MGSVSRRSVLHSSVGLAALGSLARPFIANAAASTAEVWWPQGFVPEEDVAIKKIVADYQKASGNTIDLQIMPFAPQRQKIVAAVTSGIVPDVFRNNPDEIVGLYAWDDKLVDVSDVLEAQKEEFTETALLNTYCYNSVTKDGQLHLDDPQVKEAAIKALTYPSTAYKEGFVPPSALNWNDADDNNAFHAKQIVMDLDGTISTEVALLSQGKKEDYDDVVTMGLALSNDGKPVPSLGGSYTGLIPKGAKNVAVAKEYLKFLIQPKVVGQLLKTGLGRRAPAMPSIVKDDPWWTDPKDPHVAAQTQQAVLGPTLPQFCVYNPAYAQVQNEHVFMTGWMDIIQQGMAPQAAAEKATKRVEEIFAKYEIA